MPEAAQSSMFPETKGETSWMCLTTTPEWRWAKVNQHNAVRHQVKLLETESVLEAMKHWLFEGLNVLSRLRMNWWSSGTFTKYIKSSHPLLLKIIC
jgi:hypothetical protein